MAITMANVYQGDDGRSYCDVSANTTFDATWQGVVINIVADGLTLTLPASATIGAGGKLTFRNGGAAVSGGAAGTGSNGTVGISLTPASGDGVTGFGFTAAANKGAQDPKATSHVGDELELLASGANTAAAWNVGKTIGTAWARQP